MEVVIPSQSRDDEIHIGVSIEEGHSKVSCRHTQFMILIINYQVKYTCIYGMNIT